MLFLASRVASYYSFVIVWITCAKSCFFFICALSRAMSSTVIFMLLASNNFFSSSSVRLTFVQGHAFNFDSLLSFVMLGVVLLHLNCINIHHSPKSNSCCQDPLNPTHAVSSPLHSSASNTNSFLLSASWLLSPLSPYLQKWKSHLMWDTNLWQVVCCWTPSPVDGTPIKRQTCFVKVQYILQLMFWNAILTATILFHETKIDEHLLPVIEPHFQIRKCCSSHLPLLCKTQLVCLCDYCRFATS